MLLAFFHHSISCTSFSLWDEALYGRVVINVYGNWAALFVQSNVMFKQEEVPSLQLVESVLKVPGKMLENSGMPVSI